jgi:ankyrin repeat protein
MIISRGGNVNHKDKAHQTPLFYTAREGKLEVTKLLVNNGAHVNDQDNRRQ